MNEVAIPIYISRAGQRFGPYSLPECREMIVVRQIVPSDMAWHYGMLDWRPVCEVIPNPNYYPTREIIQPRAIPVSTTLPDDEETVATILGKMGCGCVVWIGLLVLATAGGVVFPLLLIILPFLLIGGIIDMVKKIIKLVNRQY
ncbi:MAG: DUF4339 domain-containing protein [Acidobacteriota bacterium]